MRYAFLLSKFPPKDAQGYFDREIKTGDLLTRFYMGVLGKQLCYLGISLYGLYSYSMGGERLTGSFLAK